MDLFPIGTIANSSNTGTLDGITYSMFEPNINSMSQPVYNNLISLFQNQSKQTRKKAEPYLSLTYNYENIFSREYQQIEHFVDYVEDALTSFFTVDWSRGKTPSNIETSGSDWKIYIDNTRLFSTILNKKASYAFLWNGSGWKIGTVESISAGSYITMALNYGNLSLADAQTTACLYPLYEVYFTPAALSNFQSTNFIPHETMSNSGDGGWMKSGTLSFISKYSCI